MTTAIAVSYRCIRCGRATDWEETLGSEPLCDKCWDIEVDSSFKASLTGKEFSRLNQLAYRGELQENERKASFTNQAELLAWDALLSAALTGFNRWYYQIHRARLIARTRRYKLGHREKVSAGNHRNYLTHRAEFKARRRKNYLNRRTQEIEYTRNYRLTHRGLGSVNVRSKMTVNSVAV